jgi:hypothetical protein
MAFWICTGSETRPLDSDEGRRRLKIPGDSRFRDSAFNHSSDIRKGRLENIMEPGNFVNNHSRHKSPFQEGRLLKEPCSPSQAQLL